MLVRLASGTIHPCVQPMSVLVRFEANTARSCLHDDSLASSQSRAVDACSNESTVGFGASSNGDARAKHARGACASPTTVLPMAMCVPEPLLCTTPDESFPGGPGSPGYSPITLSTSRKLRPTARTRTTTSAASATSSWASRYRLVIAPRAWKFSRTRPSGIAGAFASRGINSRPVRRTASGSAGRKPLSNANSIALAEASTHCRASCASALADLASPQSPAWPMPAPPFCAPAVCASAVSSHTFSGDPVVDTTACTRVSAASTANRASMSCLPRCNADAVTATDQDPRASFADSAELDVAEPIFSLLPSCISASPSTKSSGAASCDASIGRWIHWVVYKSRCDRAAGCTMLTLSTLDLRPFSCASTPHVKFDRVTTEASASPAAVAHKRPETSFSTACPTANGRRV
eukprot:3534734-Prymnesium_polylepis.1